jgi:hypothetical protein
MCLPFRTLVVANVGDSRAVAAERVNGKIVAQDLSVDQTPYRCAAAWYGIQSDRIPDILEGLAVRMWYQGQLK